MSLKTALVLVLLPVAGVIARSAQAQSAVGRIPASYTVDAKGGFDYKVPIAVPPGPNGVTPHIALMYNDASNTAFDPDAIEAGVNWALAGLSKIERTASTVVDDGVASNPDYVPTDRYVLDGSLLRLTSSSNLADYGGDGTTYQTQIANFSQATAHGSTASGPSYWTVQTKNGLTYEYGYTSDSKVLEPGHSGDVREWLLDKVSDAYGNSYTVSYGTGSGGSSGIALPDTISWTPSVQGSSSYNYTMKFQYIGRPAFPSTYPAGSESTTGYTWYGNQIANDSLLSSITVSYNDQPVRYYQLNYSESPVTYRALLASVEECPDSSMTHCLTPTGFAYQTTDVGTPSSGQTLSGVTGVIGAFDFKGNGRSDILYLQSGTLYVAFSNGSGFDAGVSTGATPQNRQYLMGDVLGNGRDDIVVLQSGAWWVYSWDDSTQAFSGTPLNVTVCTACGESELADVNGDGMPDLLQMQTAGGGVTISVALNTSANGVASFGSATPWPVTIMNEPQGSSPIDSAWFMGPQTYVPNFDHVHLEGIKRNEVMIGWPDVISGTTYPITVVDELIPSGNAFEAWPITNSGSQVTGSVPQMFYGKFNSDACTDFTFATAAGNPASVFYSGCNGSGQQVASNIGTVVGTVDWNGDGLTDLLLKDGSNVLGIETATGSGFGPMQDTLINLQSGDTVLPLEITGSKLQDIGVISAGGTLTYYLHNQVGVLNPVDDMTATTDGNGNTVNINYGTTTESGGQYTPVYTPGTDTAGQDHPSSEVWSVVQSLTMPDGIGGTYIDDFHYTDARTSTDRGFEGFAKIRVTDSRSSEYRETSYSLLFPETGLMSEDDLVQSDGDKISTATYTNNDKELSSTQYEDRHFPYAETVKVDAYEVGGTEDGQKVSEISSSYTPDSYGNFTSVDSTTTDEDPSSPYSGLSWTSDTTASYVDDTGTWCLSLPQSISDSKTASGQLTITHTTTYTPDPSFCRPSSVLEDAGDSAYDITRGYQYDAFGNVKQVTVTGSGIDRVWTYNYGQTGQFEETVQDPVAYANNYEEKIGYDYGQGLKTSDVIQGVDGTPDAPPTQWNYDWLGRLTRETFPDGTTLNWSYAACSSSCYGGMETVAETANAASSSGVGPEITDQSTYLDSFGRAVAATKRLMDGSYALTEQQHDSYGNLVKESAPCKGCSSPTHWTQTTFDLLNRPIQSVSPAPWTSAGEGTTTISYAGGTTTVTNADNAVTTRVRDVTGALRSITDAEGYAVEFTPDSDGNVLTVADSQGTITSRTYDHGGEGDYVASAYDRAMGNWKFTPDALGDVCFSTDAKGQESLMRYDGLGRPIAREDGVSGFSGGCSGSAASYETSTQWTWGVTPANHDVGQLDNEQVSTSTDGTYVEQDSYDGDGRLQFRNITIPGDATYQYGLTYDPNTGLLSQLQYPAAGSQAGLALNYGYSSGVLSSVTDARTGTVYWQDSSPLSVNDTGESTQETLGNGIVTQTSFTPVTGWPTKIISGPTAGMASVQDQSFSYDPLGNVTQRLDGIAGLTENFYYDPDNRLQYSTLYNGSTTTTNLQLSYNPNGSIAQKTETGGTDTPVAYDVTQWTSYNYPKSISATVPSGNPETATFAYGPDRQRWRMIDTAGAGSETTEYIGGGMEKVTSNAGTDYRYYVSSAHGLAAIVSTLTGTHYVLQDQEGSVASLLTSAGTIAANESFTAYGNRREAATWSGPPSSSEETTMDSITRQGFTGQTVLGQMGLNHMNGRVEDAVSGTFLSPDPYVADPYNPQDYDRYAYVYNNPLSNVDPSGFVGFHPGPPFYSGGYTCTAWYPNLDAPPTQTGPGVDINSTTEPDYTTCFDTMPDETSSVDWLPPGWQGPPQGPSPPQQQTNSCSAGLGKHSGGATPTPVTDAQGNPVNGVSPNGTVSPMQAPASLPPTAFAAMGELANDMASSIDPYGLSSAAGGFLTLSNLASFRQFGGLDAQRVGGSYNGAFTSYANYAFGIYAAAAGLSLEQTLAGANAYASAAANYPARYLSSSYPNMLQSNVTNITNGYKSYQNGQVCTP